MANPSSERLAQLKAFDETKRVVKGLVDIGISTIPPIFIHQLSPPLSSAPPPKSSSSISIPVIDLSGIERGSVSMWLTGSEMLRKSGGCFRWWIMEFRRLFGEDVGRNKTVFWARWWSQASLLLQGSSE